MPEIWSLVLDFTWKLFPNRQYSIWLHWDDSICQYPALCWRKRVLKCLNIKMRALFYRQRKMGALFFVSLSISWLRFVFFYFLLTLHHEQMERPKCFFLNRARLKDQFAQKWKFCHHLLNQNVMLDPYMLFLMWNIKYIFNNKAVNLLHPTVTNLANLLIDTKHHKTS